MLISYPCIFFWSVLTKLLYLGLLYLSFELELPISFEYLFGFLSTLLLTCPFISSFARLWSWSSFSYHYLEYCCFQISFLTLLEPCFLNIWQYNLLKFTYMYIRPNRTVPAVFHSHFTVWTKFNSFSSSPTDSFCFPVFFYGFPSGHRMMLVGKIKCSNTPQPTPAI